MSCFACLFLRQVASSCVGIWWTNKAWLCKWWHLCRPPTHSHKFRHFRRRIQFSAQLKVSHYSGRSSRTIAGCTHLKGKTIAEKPLQFFLRRGKDNSEKQINADKSGVESRGQEQRAKSKQQRTARRKRKRVTQCRTRTRPCRTSPPPLWQPSPLFAIRYLFLRMFAVSLSVWKRAHICTCFAFVFHALLSWKLMHITYSIELHISPGSTGGGSWKCTGKKTYSEVTRGLRTF